MPGQKETEIEEEQEVESADTEAAEAQEDDAQKATEDVPAEGTAEPEAGTPDDARAKLGKFMEEFGAEQGAKWFQEGLSLQEAKDRHRAQLMREKEELEQRIEQADVGIPDEDAPDFEASEEDADGDAEKFKAMGLSDGLARFAASIEFAE